jgi:hypothetical protein
LERHPPIDRKGRHLSGPIFSFDVQLFGGLISIMWLTIGENLGAVENPEKAHAFVFSSTTILISFLSSEFPYFPG